MIEASVVIGVCVLVLFIGWGCIARAARCNDPDCCPPDDHHDRF